MARSSVVKDIGADRYQAGIHVSKRIIEFWKVISGDTIGEDLWYSYLDLAIEDLEECFLLGLVLMSKNYQFAFDGLCHIAGSLSRDGKPLPDLLQDWQTNVMLQHLPKPDKQPGEPKKIHVDIGIGNAVFTLLEGGWPLSRTKPEEACHCAADAVAVAANKSYQYVLKVWYYKVGHSRCMKRIAGEYLLQIKQLKQLKHLQKLEQLEQHHLSLLQQPKLEHRQQLELIHLEQLKLEHLEQLKQLGM